MLQGGGPSCRRRLGVATPPLRRHCVVAPSEALAARGSAQGRRRSPLLSSLKHRGRRAQFFMLLNIIVEGARCIRLLRPSTIMFLVNKKHLKACFI